jgi:hypothetical protein
MKHHFSKNNLALLFCTSVRSETLTTKLDEQTYIGPWEIRQIKSDNSAATQASVRSGGHACPKMGGNRRNKAMCQITKS